MTRADDIPDRADDGRRDVTWTGSGDDGAAAAAAVPAYGTETVADRSAPVPAEAEPDGESTSPDGGAPHGASEPRDVASEPAEGREAEHAAPGAGRVANDGAEAATDGESEIGSVAPPGEPRSPQEPRASERVLGELRRRLAAADGRSARLRRRLGGR